MEAGVLEYAYGGRAQQRGVLGDHDPHGSSTRRVVPWLGELSMAKEPPSATTRSARPRRPEARSSVAPPQPSWVTRSASVAPLQATRISAPVARAWRIVLVSASAA